MTDEELQDWNEIAQWCHATPDLSFAVWPAARPQIRCGALAELLDDYARLRVEVVELIKRIETVEDFCFDRDLDTPYRDVEELRKEKT